MGADVVNHDVQLFVSRVYANCDGCYYTFGLSAQSLFSTDATVRNLDPYSNTVNRGFAAIHAHGSRFQLA